MSAVEGRQAELVCRVENAAGFRIAWIKRDTSTVLTMDEVRVTRNSRFSVQRSVDGLEWTLRIAGLKPRDAGIYMCQIGSTPMKSATALLEVLVAPHIQDSTEDEVTVEEGEPAELKCVAKGNPRPKYVWQRENKKELIKGKKHRMRKLLLIVV